VLGTACCHFLVQIYVIRDPEQGLRVSYIDSEGVSHVHFPYSTTPALLRGLLSTSSSYQVLCNCTGFTISGRSVQVARRVTRFLKFVGASAGSKVFDLAGSAKPAQSSRRQCSVLTRTSCFSPFSVRQWTARPDAPLDVPDTPDLSPRECECVVISTDRFSFSVEG